MPATCSHKTPGQAVLQLMHGCHSGPSWHLRHDECMRLPHASSQLQHWSQSASICCCICCCSSMPPPLLQRLLLPLLRHLLLRLAVYVHQARRCYCCPCPCRCASSSGCLGSCSVCCFSACPLALPRLLPPADPCCAPATAAAPPAPAAWTACCCQHVARLYCWPCPCACACR